MALLAPPSHAHATPLQWSVAEAAIWRKLMAFRRTAPAWDTYIGTGSSASLTNLWLGIFLFTSLVAT